MQLKVNHVLSSKNDVMIHGITGTDLYAASRVYESVPFAKGHSGLFHHHRSLLFLSEQGADFHHH